MDKQKGFVDGPNYPGKRIMPGVGARYIAPGTEEWFFTRHPNENLRREFLEAQERLWKITEDHSCIHIDRSKHPWSEKNIKLLGLRYRNFARATDRDDFLFGFVKDVLNDTEEISHSFEYVFTLSWAARWAQLGFPTVKILPEQAAAFAFSDIDEEVISEVDLNFPWSAFSVRLGEGFLTSDGEQVRRISVHKFNAVPFDGENVLEVRGDYPLNGLLGVRIDVGDYQVFSTFGSVEDLVRGVAQRSDSVPERMEVITNTAAKILGNFCLFLLQPKALREVHRKKKRKGNKAKEKHRIKEMLLDTKEYVLSAPVSIDMTKQLRGLFSGEGDDRVYKSRWLVRGHWRMQACGKGRVERKAKWIAPFWKGPEKGLILTRDHVLSEAKK